VTQGIQLHDLAGRLEASVSGFSVGDRAAPQRGEAGRLSLPPAGGGAS